MRPLPCCRHASSLADHFRWCTISGTALQELQWWVSLQEVSKPLSPALLSVAVTMDASCTGWGASWGTRHLSGYWLPPVHDHISALELQVILEALCIWAPDFRETVIALHCNKSLVAYLVCEGGMHSCRLMELACIILLLADCWCLQLCLCYLLGITSLETNVLSWQEAIVEWCILPSLICKVFWILWRPQIDLFASQANLVLPVFFSIQQTNTCTQGVDALH